LRPAAFFGTKGDLPIKSETFICPFVEKFGEARRVVPGYGHPFTPPGDAPIGGVIMGLDCLDFVADPGLYLGFV
jgi:hypothetical protein